MLKVISGIAAFVLTFGISVSLVGLLFGFSSIATPSFEARDSHRVRHKITRFLVRDVRNGRLRDREVRRKLYERRSTESVLEESFLPEYSQATSAYVRRSSSMNDSFLPADLRYAWRKHMEAWQRHSAFLESAARGETGPDYLTTYDGTQKEIEETWFQVLRIAERYGVRTRGMR